ncbi:MAG: hypothetical protein ACRC53_01355 [Plesiomonas sp.]|uniref:hypothetical protein n=1 Tax=Plesiomonas sp. TaxID=2486279 RepID=UPI003F39AFE1
MLKHIKGDTWSFLGTTFTTEYMNRVHIPMLLDVLGWSVSYVANMIDDSGFPATRHPKLINHYADIQEAKETAERQRLENEAHYRMMNPTQEEIKQRQTDEEAFRAHCLRQAALVKGRKTHKSAYGTNYGGGINRSGDWE